MAKSDLPMVPKVLLEGLEKRFKDTVPDTTDYSLEQFRFLQGQLSVIRFLRKEYERQTKDILEN